MDSAADIAIEGAGLFHIFRETTLETVALRGAALTLRRGSWASVTGPSGSGKSTLLHVMAGLLEPSGGSVLLDGVDLTRLPAPERAQRRRQRIGVVLQRDNLHPLFDVAGNIQLPLRLDARNGAASRERARVLLERVGLADRGHHTPAQLSGGEAQRAAIAVALAAAPAIVLADEPTGELDEHTGDAVLDLLGEIRDEGTAVLTVTHNPAVAERADRRLQMLDGLVVDDD
ncbi:MAG: putative transport system ATP-binding protein [Pseudonocardiales bacterium]|nr:putative transport system ATP-binding protein [Pseudonocardiales bacterium]